MPMAREGPHVLVVDDQQEVCDLIHEYLTDEGFRVSTANDGAGLREAIARSRIDLVILDLKLGHEDGLQLAGELRSQPDMGIVILTGRGEMVDRVIGLEIGADDYLTKPFHLRELLARVRSVLRRAATRAKDHSAAHRSLVRFHGWTINLAARTLTSPTGEEVPLTTGEFELLAVFVTHPSRVLSRDLLLELTRHRDAGPFDRTIDVQVGRLRRKLDDDPKNPMLIKTVRGGGYMFTLPVELAAPHEEHPQTGDRRALGARTVVGPNQVPRTGNNLIRMKPFCLLCV